MNAASNPDSDRWQETIASAVGAFPRLPQADETLTERHRVAVVDGGGSPLIAGDETI